MTNPNPAPADQYTQALNDASAALVAVDAAKAKLATDKANLKNAEKAFNRFPSGVRKSVIQMRQMNTANATTTPRSRGAAGSQATITSQLTLRKVVLWILTLVVGLFILILLTQAWGVYGILGGIVVTGVLLLVMDKLMPHLAP